MKVLIGFETRTKNKQGWLEAKEVKYYASSPQELFDRLMRLRRLADLYRVRVYFRDGRDSTTVAYVRPKEGDSYDAGKHAPVRFEGKGLLNPEYLDEVAGAIWNWCIANSRYYDRSNNYVPDYLKRAIATPKKRYAKGDRVRHYWYLDQIGTVVEVKAGGRHGYLRVKFDGRSYDEFIRKDRVEVIKKASEKTKAEA